MSVRSVYVSLLVVLNLNGGSVSKAGDKEEFLKLYPPAVERLRSELCNQIEGDGTWAKVRVEPPGDAQTDYRAKYAFFVDLPNIRIDMERPDIRQPGKSNRVTLVVGDELTYEVSKNPSDAAEYTLRFAGRDKNQDAPLLQQGSNVFQAAFSTMYFETMSVLKLPAFTVESVTTRRDGDDTIWVVQFEHPQFKRGAFEVNQEKLWRLESYHMTWGDTAVVGRIQYDDLKGVSPIASGYVVDMTRPGGKHQVTYQRDRFKAGPVDPKAFDPRTFGLNDLIPGAAAAASP